MKTDAGTCASLSVSLLTTSFRLSNHFLSFYYILRSISGSSYISSPIKHHILMLTINESVGSDCNRLFRRRQLWCYQSRWIVFSWTWPIYDRCSATRSSAVAEMPHDASLSHSTSLKMVQSIDHIRISIRLPLLTMAISCIFYPSFISVTLDTITHATTLHYRPYTSMPVLPSS